MIGREFWDISPLFSRKPPLPKHEIRCPVCGGEEIYFKQAHSFKRSPNQYRTDITVKCGRCALVFTFGVHLTEEEFNRLDAKLLEYAHTGHVNVNKA